MASSGVLVPIQTVTITTTNVTGIEFLNIPQTFTDLVVKASIRSAGASVDALGLVLNATYSGYSRTALWGNGSNAQSNRASYRDVMEYFNSGDSTANVFSSVDITIPNYRSTTQKSAVIEGVSENNGTTAYTYLTAFLQNITTAITQVRLDSSRTASAFAVGSTATLYGTLKA